MPRERTFARENGILVVQGVNPVVVQPEHGDLAPADERAHARVGDDVVQPADGNPLTHIEARGLYIGGAGIGHGCMQTV
jgi:hypothetical protein